MIANSRLSLRVVFSLEVNYSLISVHILPTAQMSSWNVKHSPLDTRWATRCNCSVEWVRCITSLRLNGSCFLFSGGHRGSRLTRGVGEEEEADIPQVHVPWSWLRPAARYVKVSTELIYKRMVLLDICEVNLMSCFIYFTLVPRVNTH